MSDEKNEEAAGGEQRPPLVNDVAEVLWGVFRGGSKLLAKEGRGRLESYQAKKDLEKLYLKLGRETVRLIDAGEIDHPGLAVGADRIRRQQAILDGLEPVEGEE
ncbi:MAG: hypothetical protein GY913_25065 [Proteobacteria bacterium]|nr:hypothetical protein [Pseudomonadota bacterium]MCP4920185.1 hypothetical protein [Pseudomonadota bacterium]